MARELELKFCESCRRWQHPWMFEKVDWFNSFIARITLSKVCFSCMQDLDDELDEHSDQLELNFDEDA